MIGLDNLLKNIRRSGIAVYRAILCALLALSITDATTPANAAPTPVTANPAAASAQTLIYNGENSSRSAVTVANWGGGTASIDTSPESQNGSAIKINSTDLYQGGVVTLNSPIAIPTADNQHNWYLFVTLKVIQTAPDGSVASNFLSPPTIDRLAEILNSRQNQRPALGYGVRLVDDDDRGDDQRQMVPAQQALPAQYGRRRRNGGGPPQGNGIPRNGFPNPNGFQQSRPVSPDTPVTIPTIRVQLTLADGSTTDIERDMPAHYADAPDEYMRIGIPVAAMKFTNGIAAPLQKITIGSLPSAMLWVSQIGFVQDNTPINASAGPAQDISKGDPVDLSATADGGLAGLHYAWTFRDADGTLEEASGPTATTSYGIGGTTYKVTLVVSDVDGVKKPVTVTTSVKVEE
jgi:hypothetical protein